MDNSSGKDQQEQQQQQSGGGMEIQSKFLDKLFHIPLIHITILFANDCYAKAKSTFWIVGKTAALVEGGLGYVRSLMVPLMAQFQPITGPLSTPLHKVDDLATKGLETLERTVPVIKKQPQEIVSETKEIISSRVNPAVERLNEVSENVLSSRPAQFTLDCYEKVLVSGNAVVNSVLSAKESDQPGFPHEKAPDSAAARPGYLFRGTVHLATSTVQRLFSMAKTRTDSVVHSVRKTL